MNFHVVEPTGFLKNHIRHYCFMESDIFETDVTERVIPIGNIQLMFHYGDPFVIHQPCDSYTRQPRSIISGLSDSFSDVSTGGKTGVAFISFYPASACHFFDFSLAEIENKSINLADIYHAKVRQIEEMLYQKSTIHERVKIIENFLLKQFSHIPAHDSLLIQNGYEYIVNNRGQINTGTLANALSITPKTLERKFSRYLGKTTKQVIRLVRFQQVLQCLGNNRNMSMTDCAYKNGYFDQSHFIHDFKSMSGYTPKEFVSRYPDCYAFHESC